MVRLDSNYQVCETVVRGTEAVESITIYNDRIYALSPDTDKNIVRATTFPRRFTRLKTHKQIEDYLHLV